AAANDVINLRGLIVEGAGLGQTGIQFNTGKSLTIENCMVRNLAGTGIYFSPVASSNLAITSTFIANTNIGIWVLPTGAGAVNVVINRVEVHNSNNSGIELSGVSSTGTINGVVTDS